MLVTKNLDDQRKETARVAICQLSLEIEQVSLAGKKAKNAEISKVKSKIFRSLTEIENLCAKKENPQFPDLVVFPECSIDRSIVQDLEDFSNSKNCIIVAGSHYIESKSGFVSRSPIIFPSDATYYSQKLNPSPLEKQAVAGLSVTPGEKRYYFKNTPIGNFIVYICADFLHNDTPSEIATYDPHLVIVTALNADTPKHYFPKLAAAANAGVHGAYVLYSNMKLAMNGRTIADGRSSLFAITDTRYHDGIQRVGFSDMLPQEKVWEAHSDNDFLICDLNLGLRKPEKPSRIETGPNLSLIASRRKKHQHKSYYRSAKPYKLVAFDVDGTLLRGIEYSWTRLWELCGDDGTIWRRLMDEYRNGKLEYADWCETAVRYFRDQKLTQKFIEMTAREEAYLVKNFEEGISRLKAAGFRTAIISGGIDAFLRPLIPNYRELFDRDFINRMTFDAEGVVAGVDHTLYDYENKAKALENICDEFGISIDHSIYCGDSVNDDHALELSGYGILIGESQQSVEVDYQKHIRSDNFDDIVSHIFEITKLD